MPVRPKLDLRILGGSGLDRSGYITEDFLSKLHGLNGVKSYREMSDNDPVIGAILYAITTLLRGVEWRVEPAKDSGAKGEEAQQFVHEVFFEDMSHTWADFLEECLTFLPYGFSVHEIVYKKRGGLDTTDPSKYSRFTDGRIGIRKLAGRPQETINKWDLQPDGGIQGLWQVLPWYTPVAANSDLGSNAMPYIPIEKLLLFRAGIRKNNPEGRSVLRTSYVPYQRKVAVEIAEGRAAMRSAGVVQLKIPAEYMDPGADETYKGVYALFKTMADRLAQDRQGSIVLPSTMNEQGKPLFEMAYISTDGRRPADMTAIIERYDKRIASTVLADFILLGQQAVGSFALSSDKTALFSASLDAHNSTIAETLNRVALPRLWRLNNFDTKLMPKLVAGEIDKQSLDEVSNFLLRLTQAGMPAFPDDDLEKSLRKIAGLPMPSPETIKIRQQASAHEDAMNAAARTEATANAQVAQNEADNPDAQVDKPVKPKVKKDATVSDVHVPTAEPERKPLIGRILQAFRRKQKKDLRKAVATLQASAPDLTKLEAALVAVETSITGLRGEVRDDVEKSLDRVRFELAGIAKAQPTPEFRIEDGAIQVTVVNESRPPVKKTVAMTRPDGTTASGTITEE